MTKPLLCSVIVISLCSSLLLGCWDRQEIEQRMAVTALGIDLTDNEYEVTIAAPIPQQIIGGAGGGAGEGANPIEYLSVKAKNLSEAMSKLEAKSNKPQFVGNMQVILFGEEAARRGIEPFLDALRRSPEIRRQLWPIVVKGTAKESITKTTTKTEQVPTNFIKDMLEYGGKEEILPSFDLGRLFVELSSKSRQAPALNYIIAEKDKYHWRGIALFKQGKMIGILEDKDEISAFLQMRFANKGRIIMAPCGVDRENLVTFQPNELTKQLSVTDDQPQIRVNFKLEGKIIERNCPLNLRNEKNLSLLEKKIATSYKDAAERLIRRAQRDWKWDLFHFGDYVRAYNPEIWSRINWWQSFPQIPIKVDYQVKINRIGLQSH